MAYTIALASGKGGVGKTTTATNLALFAVGMKKKVVLVDIDPLSDVASILDIPQSKIDSIPKTLDPEKNYKEYMIKLFDGLELLFPLSKTGHGERQQLYQLLKDHFWEGMKKDFDLIILDMAAGADEQENLQFLDMADRIVVVTNPEPAAHLAAVNYLRFAADYSEKHRFFIWHNRYRPLSVGGFNPTDIIGTYNRNMPPEERVDHGEFELEHCGYIPEDPSLDLLQGEPAVLLQLTRNMRSTIDGLYDLLLAQISPELLISTRMNQLLRGFTRGLPVSFDPATAVRDFGEFLHSILQNQLSLSKLPPKAGSLFTETQEKGLTSYFQRCSANRVRSQMIKTLSLLTKKEEVEESRFDLFSGVTPGGDPGHALDREITALLMFLAEEIGPHPDMKNMSGLLMFYFSLYKLFQSDKIVDTLNGFVPRRRENGGVLQRDRHSQIISLVNHSDQYRRKYISLIKKLFPLVTRQLEVMSKTFELQDLVFTGPFHGRHGENAHTGKTRSSTRKSGASGEIYARLTSAFVHEAVNSGLGILISFQHRPASAAFYQAASTILTPVEQL